MLLDHFLEVLLGGGSGDPLEDVAEPGATAERRSSLGTVLLKMKLAALQRHAQADGPAGGLEPGVIVADKDAHVAESALLQPVRNSRQFASASLISTHHRLAKVPGPASTVVVTVKVAA